jgi:16S rRNA (cytosine967-C5)-methyltransferase
VFAEGLATVQDLGAQRIARLLEPPAGARLLDACSGVGGKATHLVELAGAGAHVDAADLSARKLDLAADTARRLGHESQIRTVVCDLTDGRAPLGASYDAVLLDAPCSGLGVLRRHPEAKWRPRPALAALASTQARLLETLAARVRPGGALVYAVCTFTDEEGPAQLARFAAAHPEFTVERELRTWPHRDDADAFFAARLRRRGET